MCIRDSLLLDGRLDGFRARSEQLARVEALALPILAGLDVSARRGREGELALGVDVDLRNAEADGLLDHVGREDVYKRQARTRAS